ncbi:MAG: DUF721 domain-containing protein [Cyclobacteriaceae bacterium]|nr:DUF721 domain-containing protein [Cyclobacteriaceae bacterium]
MRKPNGKRKKETTSAGDAIRELLDTYRIKSKYSQTEVKTSWEQLMGKAIASRTTKLFFKKNILFVELNSAALKQELNMSKSKVVDILQQKFGKSVVEEVVFL